MDRKRVWLTAGGFVALGVLCSGLVWAEPAGTASGFSDYYAELASDTAPLEPASYGDDVAACGDTAGCSDCAGSCELDCCCDDGGGCRRIIAGVEATFLAPTIYGNGGTLVMSDLVTPVDAVFNSFRADDLAAGPRVWLGIQGDCWAFTARYWGLEGSQTEIYPFDSVWGSTHYDGYEFETVDLELSRCFVVRCTEMTASFGVRWAQFENRNSVSVVEDITGNLHTGSALVGRHNDSTGLVFGLTGLRQVGCSSWNLYWNLRGSILWGETDHFVQTSATAAGPGGAAGSINGALASADETLFIGEVQIGMQRDFALECIPATAFFKAAFEYQYWDADSNAGAFAVSAAALPTSANLSAAVSGDLRADLVGFNVGAGFYW